jgi:hypothetical protein
VGGFWREKRAELVSLDFCLFFFCIFTSLIGKIDDRNDKDCQAWLKWKAEAEILGIKNALDAKLKSSPYCALFNILSSKHPYFEINNYIEIISYFNVVNYQVHSNAT